MREQFVATARELLRAREDLAVVLADISADRFPEHPGVVNVGIREQTLIGVAAGLALTGIHPIVHSYAPFLIERPFEQVKLDLSHQDVGATLVSIGASYDVAAAGRTHHAPGDVALLDTLPGWRVDVPGHPDEVGPLLRRAVTARDRSYLRLSEAANARPGPLDGRVRVVRRAGGPVVLAVGPLLDRVLAAAAGLPVSVLHAVTVRPLDLAGIAAQLDAAGTADLVLAEPYLAGTSAATVAAGLDRPLRLRALGVGGRGPVDLHRFGSPADHDAAHGLDVAGLRAALVAVLDG